MAWLSLVGRQSFDGFCSPLIVQPITLFSDSVTCFWRESSLTPDKPMLIQGTRECQTDPSRWGQAVSVHEWALALADSDLRLSDLEPLNNRADW